MTVLWCLLAALYGLFAAEAVRRAAYRMSVEPEQPPRAICPAGHPLPRGPLGWAGPARCRLCVISGERRAWYGPLPNGVRVCAAAACALLVYVTGARPELAVWLLLVPPALLLAVIDTRVRRLPDVLTLPLAVGTTVLLGVAETLPGEAGSWRGALLGALALTAFYVILFLVNPDGMGFGDVKLAATAGLVLGWYGWGTVFVGTFAGFLLGAAAALVLVARREADRRTALPFGPYLLLGTLVGVALGPV